MTIDEHIMKGEIATLKVLMEALEARIITLEDTILEMKSMRKEDRKLNDFQYCKITYRS